MKILNIDGAEIEIERAITNSILEASSDGEIERIKERIDKIASCIGCIAEYLVLSGREEETSTLLNNLISYKYSLSR